MRFWSLDFGFWWGVMELGSDGVGRMGAIDFRLPILGFGAEGERVLWEKGDRLILEEGGRSISHALH